MSKAELIAYVKDVQERWKDYTTVQYASKPAKALLHPTVKPIELVGTLMKNSSKRGWNIYDPFGGSGTTLITAERLGRKCYTMELSPHYCDVILARYEKETGKKPELIREGAVT
jgi:DNA modification methylase